MEYLGADVGVVGEGELAFPWVLERLAARRAARDRRRRYRCEPVDGGVCVTPVARIKQLDVTGVPMRERFDMQRYYERGGALNIQTKRGCYFECVFCSYPLIEGVEGAHAQRRRRSSTRSRRCARAHGVRHWFFVDNIFNMPIRHAKEICEEIVARDLDIEWSGYLNPKFIDDELCALMARSGCKAIEFGTDSGSPTMIANLKKEFDVDDLRRDLARSATEHGLKFCHSLIFGGPGETEQTVDRDDRADGRAAADGGDRDDRHPHPARHRHGRDRAARRADRRRRQPALPEASTSRRRSATSSSIASRRYARQHSNWIVPGLGHQDEHRRCCRSCASARSRASCGGCCDERDPLRLDGQARAGHRRVARHRARHRRGAGGGGRRGGDQLRALGRRGRGRRRRAARRRRRGRGRPGRRRRRGAGGGDVRRICATRWDGVDILVNNAAVTHDGFVMLMTPGGVGRGAGGQPARRVPVRAPGAAADDRRKWGRIVNVVSPAALLGKDGAANYAAAKGGLLSFTKSLAREVGRYGITVNAVCPGLVDTRLIAEMPAAERARHEGAIALGRFGDAGGSRAGDPLPRLARRRLRHRRHAGRRRRADDGVSASGQSARL